MGQGWVKNAPSWDIPVPAGGEYDIWGYKPSGLNPPQHEWNQFYQEGHAPKLDQGKAVSLLIPGQHNDKLEVFGHSGKTRNTEGLTGRVKNMWDTTEKLTAIHTIPHNQQVQQFAQITYMSSAEPTPWAPDATTCNPTNYPDCSLVSMRQNAPLIQPHANWWSTTRGVEFLDILKGADASLSVNQPVDTIPDEGQIEFPMDNWVAAIDRTVANYAAGGTAALTEVNSQDTSNFDPCDDPASLEVLLPLLFAGASGILVRTYGEEALAFLPSPAKIAIEGGVMGGFWFVGKAAAVSVRVPGTSAPLDPTEEKDDLDIAAQIMAQGIGAAAGVIASQKFDFEYATQSGFVGGAFLGNLVLQPPISFALNAGSIVGDLALLPVYALNVMAKWFCNMSNWGHTACNDFLQTGTATYQDARRWDVGSIAARLTDIACDTEGWERDSPQARFVYEGLMRNPAFMQAATLGPTFAQKTGGDLGIYGRHATNPIGEIAPIHDGGGQTLNSNQTLDVNPQGGYFVKGSEIDFQQTWSSFTGEADVTYMEGKENHNRFACQNWDILFNADECEPTDDPSSTKACAANPSAVGEDMVFAARMKQWLAHLVTSAKDPNNYTKAAHIPGLFDTTYNPVRIVQLSPQVYLQTCAKDNSGPTGFDHVHQRGLYATENYLADNQWHVESGSLEEVIITANSYFAYAGELAAWAAVEKDPRWGGKLNIIALVHYWHGEKGPIQQDDFERNWKQTNARIDELLLLPDPGFEPFPDKLTSTQRVYDPIGVIYPGGLKNIIPVPKQTIGPCNDQILAALGGSSMQARYNATAAKSECLSGSWQAEWLQFNNLVYAHAIDHNLTGANITTWAPLVLQNAGIVGTSEQFYANVFYALLGEPTAGVNFGHSLWFTNFWYALTPADKQLLNHYLTAYPKPADYPSIWNPLKT